MKNLIPHQYPTNTNDAKQKFFPRCSSKLKKITIIMWWMLRRWSSACIWPVLPGLRLFLHELALLKRGLNVTRFWINGESSPLTLEKYPIYRMTGWLAQSWTVTRSLISVELYQLLIPPVYSIISKQHNEINSYHPHPLECIS